MNNQEHLLIEEITPNKKFFPGSDEEVNKGDWEHFTGEFTELNSFKYWNL